MVTLPMTSRDPMTS